MYHAKALHPLSDPLPSVPPDVGKALWELFVAVGATWKFPDDPEQYRLRFQAFIQNRLALYPFYASFYQSYTDLINGWIAQAGAEAAYNLLFFGNNPHDLQFSPELFHLLEQYVVNEHINFRLACGSFKVWGAINYCGYFGGANLKDEPVPYRTAKGLKK
jgi:hypothetical protein